MTEGDEVLGVLLLVLVGDEDGRVRHLPPAQIIRNVTGFPGPTPAAALVTRLRVALVAASDTGRHREAASTDAARPRR